MASDTHLGALPAPAVPALCLGINPRPPGCTCPWPSHSGHRASTVCQALGQVWWGEPGREGLVSVLEGCPIRQGRHPEWQTLRQSRTPGTMLLTPGGPDSFPQSTRSPPQPPDAPALYPKQTPRPIPARAAEPTTMTVAVASSVAKRYYSPAPWLPFAS